MFNFEWKGNIRQLKNVIESLVVMDTDGVLDLDDLSPDLAGATTASPSNSSTSEHSTFLIGKSLRDIERWAIEQTLQITGGNREETARMLGISERNLYRKLKEYELGQK